jgi:hypothetical protein
VVTNIRDDDSGRVVEALNRGSRVIVAATETDRYGRLGFTLVFRDGVFELEPAND